MITCNCIQNCRLSTPEVMAVLLNVLFFIICFNFLISRLLQKSLEHTPSLAHLDKVNSNSLDSCISIQDLPSKVPPYSTLQDLAGSHTSTHLTPSPAPVLHIDSSTTYTTDNSPLMYPKISGMHYSMESLSLQMSLPSRFVKAEMHDSEERGTGTWGAASKTSYKQTHGYMCTIYLFKNIVGVKLVL